MALRKRQSNDGGSENPGKIIWMVFDPLPSLMKADCGGAVGDCLFECVAHWLHLRQRRQFVKLTALELRARAATKMTAENFAIINDDIATGENLPACATLEDLRARVVTGGVWGCEALLLALLAVVSDAVNEETGAMVAYRADRAPHLFCDDSRHPRIFIVL